MLASITNPIPTTYTHLLKSPPNITILFQFLPDINQSRPINLPQHSDDEFKQEHHGEHHDEHDPPHDIVSEMLGEPAVDGHLAGRIRVDGGEEEVPDPPASDGYKGAGGGYPGFVVVV
jgi:hypothetical protein